MLPQISPFHQVPHPAIPSQNCDNVVCKANKVEAYIKNIPPLVRGRSFLKSWQGLSALKRRGCESKNQFGSLWARATLPILPPIQKGKNWRSTSCHMKFPPSPIKTYFLHYSCYLPVPYFQPPLPPPLPWRPLLPPMPQSAPKAHGKDVLKCGYQQEASACSLFFSIIFTPAFSQYQCQTPL
jgi:hypothetical protein